MNNLIDRQQAIESFYDSISGVPVEVVQYVKEYADKMMKRIECLPSAEPEQLIDCTIDDGNKVDLIDRYTAINAIKRRLAEPTYQHTGEDWYVGMNDAESELLDLPSAQLERKKGKWIKVPGFATPGGDPVWACSECGKGIHVYGVEHRTYGADISDGQWKACPNCGAEMEGKQDGWFG